MVKGFKVGDKVFGCLIKGTKRKPKGLDNSKQILGVVVSIDPDIEDYPIEVFFSKGIYTEERWRSAAYYTTKGELHIDEPIALIHADNLTQ